MCSDLQHHPVDNTPPSDLNTEKRSEIRPRNPRASPLWQLIHRNFSNFIDNYEQKHRKTYGYLRSWVIDSMQRFLKCGDFSQGFTQLYCNDCHMELLVAHSCKNPACPSCHQKRLQIIAPFIVEEICENVPHRHYVFTIPKILRARLRYDRKITRELYQCAQQSLTTFFREVLRLPSGQIGAIMTLQTFGSYLGYSPHIHGLIANGLFDKEGNFHLMPDISTKPLEEIYRANVLKILRENGKISEELANNLFSWQNSGFSAHNGEIIASESIEGPLNIAEYILRMPISLDAIEYNPEQNTILMRNGKNYATGLNYHLFSATDFIASFVQHLPDKNEQTVRYFGFYSNKSRGVRAKKLGLVSPEAPYTKFVETPYRLRVKQKRWREIILDVYEVDPCLCPKCGKEMEFSEAIRDPVYIELMLSNRSIWKSIIAIPQPNSPPRDPHTLETVPPEPNDKPRKSSLEYWKAASEPVIVDYEEDYLMGIKEPSQIPCDTATANEPQSSFDFDNEWEFAHSAPEDDSMRPGLSLQID